METGCAFIVVSLLLLGFGDCEGTDRATGARSVRKKTLSSEGINHLTAAFEESLASSSLLEEKKGEPSATGIPEEQVEDGKASGHLEEQKEKGTTSSRLEKQEEGTARGLLETQRQQSATGRLKKQEKSSTRSHLENQKEEEEKEEEGTSHSAIAFYANGRTPPPIIMPDLSITKAPESHLEEYFVDIEGDKYLDISSVSESTLEVPRWLNGIRGITALNKSSCKVKTLTFLEGYHLSSNITNCKTIKMVTLLGSKWLCGDDWSWLDDVKNQWEVLYDDALCSDIKGKEDQGYGMLNISFAEGRDKVQQLGIEVCPRVCEKCTTILTSNKQFDSHRITCEFANITDDNIPDVTKQTTHLYLTGNQLRYTGSIFKKLEYLEGLTEIVLPRNQLEELPYLREGFFPKLNRIDLKYNAIKKINIDAFKTMISRDLQTDLFGNVFACDCNSHFFLKLCLENITKVKEFIKYPFRCSPGPNEIPQLLLPKPECEPSVTSTAAINLLPYVIAILIALNAIFVFFVFDLLRAIRECRSTVSVTEPKFHLMAVGCQGALEFLFGKRQKKEEEVAEPPSSMERKSRFSSNLEVSGVPGDRASYLRRQERRLTPGPS